MKKHWIAERNGNYLSSPRMKIQLSGYAIRYNPTPEPPRDEQGRPTSFSLTFPALVLTSWVSESEKIAAQVAHQLNTYPALVEALKQAESLLVTAFGEPAHPPRALENGRAADGIHSIRATVAAAEAEPGVVS